MAGTGVEVESAGASFVVCSVIVNSPAAESCAIFPGDELVSIGGQLLGGFDLKQVRELLDGPAGSGTEVGIKAKGDSSGNVLVLSLARRELEDPLIPGGLAPALDSKQCDDKGAGGVANGTKEHLKIENSGEHVSEREMVNEVEEAGPPHQPKRAPEEIGGTGRVLAYIKNQMHSYVLRLREAAAIQSVNSENQRRSDCSRVLDWFNCWGTKFGAENASWLSEGSEKKALLLTFPGRSSESLLVHVQCSVDAAYMEDGWKQDPFLLRTEAGKMLGRLGGKADATAWMWAIEAYRETGQDLPIKVMILFDIGMAASREQWETNLTKLKPNLSADHVVVCGSQKLRNEVPSIVLGCRGVLHFTISLSSRQAAEQGNRLQKTHSKSQNATTRLLSLVKALLDSKFSTKNSKFCSASEEDMEHCADLLGLITGNQSNFDEKLVEYLEKDRQGLVHLWHSPALTVHEVETVDQENAVARISMRLVGGMEPAQTLASVTELLQLNLAETMQNKHPFELQVVELQSFPPVYNGWQSAFKALQCAQRAILHVTDTEADVIWEASNLPAASALQDHLKKPVLILPTAGPSAQALCNEWRYKWEYSASILMFASLLHEFTTQPTAS